MTPSTSTTTIPAMTHGNQDRPSGSVFFSERNPPVPLFPALDMAAILRWNHSKEIRQPITGRAHFTNSSFDFSATLVTMGRLKRQAFDPCPRSEPHAGDTRRNPERPAAPLSRSESKQVAGVRLPCRDPGRGHSPALDSRVALGRP